MTSVYTKIMPLTVLAILIVAISIYADLGTRSWVWFQRSGSIVVLIGAFLGYRSILRLGKSGVGGVNPVAVMAKVISTDNTGPTTRVRVALDERTQRLLQEAEYDKLAGFVGVFFIVFGTLVWGYGDLVGLI
jgi:hypothetical protein